MYKKVIKYNETLIEKREQFVNDLYKAERPTSSKFIFSADNPLHKQTLNIPHENLVDGLQRKGYHVEEASGTYGGESERTFVVQNPPDDAMPHLHSIVKQLGQESSLYTKGQKNELHFHNGKHEGFHMKGQGIASHRSQPKQDHIALDNGSFVTHDVNTTMIHKPHHNLISHLHKQNYQPKE